MTDVARLLIKGTHAAERARERVDRTLPTAELNRGARRLQFVALLMAWGVVVAHADLLWLPQRRVAELDHIAHWLPDVINVAASLGIFALARSRRLPIDSLLHLGLLYEVMAAYAIGFAQFWSVLQGIDPSSVQMRSVGLGWVVAWVIVFAVVVPTRPIRTLTATLLSITSVPVVVALSISAGRTPPVTPGTFVSAFVVPYLIAAVSAYFVSHVVYRLGKEVQEAQEMGSYKLESVIGKGGMGEVWRARHRYLARAAAIKLIRPEVLGQARGETVSRALARFEREAQATAALECPHTINLYDYGATDDGGVYYVMELLDGVDMQTFVYRHGPQPPERVVEWLWQACQSLEEAHEAGLVHRDVKPANLFVCRYGLDHDFVKVLDFGLVALRAAPASPRMTADDTIQGTPAFIAPEMVTQKEGVDGRADIYSLGCVAFWLLSGCLVFQEDSVLEVMIDHVQRAPPRVGEVSDLEIPPELEQLVMDCLEKSPDDRPQSAGELAERLKRIPLKVKWTPQRAKTWRESHPEPPANVDVDPGAPTAASDSLSSLPSRPVV